MGYAFLYGVFGSLLGSNLGAVLYGMMLKPVIGTEQASARSRIFWLMFAVLDIVAAGVLIWFARTCGEDTAPARRRAAAVMGGVYALIAVLGIGFLFVAFSGEEPQVRTAVQAGIFLLLGAGGFVVNRRRPVTA
jgi:cytochrome c oxidase assembly factor CtaG